MIIFLEAYPLTGVRLLKMKFSPHKSRGQCKNKVKTKPRNNAKKNVTQICSHHFPELQKKGGSDGAGNAFHASKPE